MKPTFIPAPWEHSPAPQPGWIPGPWSHKTPELPGLSGLLPAAELSSTKPRPSARCVAIAPHFMRTTSTPHSFLSSLPAEGAASRGITGVSRQDDLPSLKCLLGGFLLQHPSLLLSVLTCRCGIWDAGCSGWSVPTVCAAPPERPAKLRETSCGIEMKSPGITSWQQV